MSWNKRQKLISCVFICSLIFISEFNIILIKNGNSNPTIPYSSSKKVDKEKYILSKEMQYDQSLGAMNDIFIQENLAFVAVKWGGLAIFNISNLNEPTLIGSYNEPYERESGSENLYTSGVFVKESIVFVADGENGLIIINATDPSNPYKIGHYKEISNTWRNYHFIFVENSYVYIANNIYLIIIDITDYANPIKVSETRFLCNMANMHVINGLIFIGKNQGAGTIINASNPLQPEVITQINETKAFDIQQNNTFSITTNNHLVIFDLQSFPNLVLLSNTSLPFKNTAKYLCVNQELAFIGSVDEIIIVNISNTISPNTIKVISDVQWLQDAGTPWISRVFATPQEIIRRDILLCTDYQQGLLIYNISKDPTEELIGYYNCGMRAELVAVKNEFIYLASRPEKPYYPMKLEIFALEEDNLELISTYYSPNRKPFHDIEITDDEKIFLQTGNGIEVVDISNPYNPQFICNYSYSKGLFAWNFYYNKEHSIIYIACNYDGLVILDVSNLNNITLLDHIESFHGYGAQFYDVTISDNIAYIADAQTFGGFGIINVSNPSAAETLDYIPLNEGIAGIHIDNKTAYLFSTSIPTMQIFDISDLEEIKKISECGTDGTNDRFSIENNLIVTSEYIDGVTLFDVSNKNNPKEIITFKDTGTGLSIDTEINNSLIFIADAWDGLEVWSIKKTSISRVFEISLIIIIPIIILSAIITTIILVRKKKSIKENTMA